MMISIHKTAVKLSIMAALVLSIVSEYRAMAPQEEITSQPVRRTTAQIMQGEVAAPLKATPLTPPSIVPGIPAIGANFITAHYQETGQYGPSGESSMGSTQLLVASKGRIRSFLRDGRIDNVLNLSHDSFFSPVSAGGFTADPNVIYHPILKRWIILANALLKSSIVLAVSDSDPITPATVWTFYIVDTVSLFNTLPGFTSTAFFDYPTLGADANAIYCAANILDPKTPGVFLSAAAYVIPVSTLSSTGPATIYAWRNLAHLGPQNLTPFTFQPALNFDVAPTAGYFASINYADAAANSSSRFLVNTVTFGVGGVPTLSDPIQIPVQNYVATLAISALGTPLTHIIDPVAFFRLAPAHVRNNRLWLVNNIGVDNNGLSNPPYALPPVGTITRNGARFTQIDVTQLATPATAVVSQGTLFQASAANDIGERSFLTPSIMSNAHGAVIIAATTCAANERLNAAVAQLTQNNTAVGEPVLYTNSTFNYFATEDWEFNPFARWGDHTRISPDPSDPNAFWTIQQWCSDTNTWGLQAAQIFAH